MNQTTTQGTGRSARRPVNPRMSTGERSEINHHLRQALHAARLSDADVAARVGVDPKTVNRWVAGRLPHPRHRYAVADLLRCEVHELWPQLAPGPSSLNTGEVLAVYPARSAVPAELWRALFASARERIDVLVYSGLFLAEDARIRWILDERADAGVPIRLLLGDPDGEHVARRGHEEGIGEAMGAKVRNALVLYRRLAHHPGVELRLHDTPLYASIYRADHELLVNTHIHRTPAACAPVHHLRVPLATSMPAPGDHATEGPTATAGDQTGSGGAPEGVGIARSYLDAFEATWAEATPTGPTKGSAAPAAA